MEKDLVESLLSELRRGTLILGVLSQLDESRYGYALIQSLEEKGMSIDANTLYPLLRRLEKQELLCSEWNTEEAKPRKYYKRTEYGDTVYKIMIEQWNKISEGMAGLIGGNE
ncbi:MAG: helix-turn-helix transcriptional regulator [Lachnospiraceae bacterium]|jgi:DNA-binding PadR family transcriptional regulator|nr:helix-turn-helix transcriptional regulator [Lachnospiraceae bacterium]